MRILQGDRHIDLRCQYPRQSNPHPPWRLPIKHRNDLLSQPANHWQFNRQLLTNRSNAKSTSFPGVLFCSCNTMARTRFDKCGNGFVTPMPTISISSKSQYDLAFFKIRGMFAVHPSFLCSTGFLGLCTRKTGWNLATYAFSFCSSDILALCVPL